MEKVILITSREFIGLIDDLEFKELNYQFVKEEKFDPIFDTKKTELKGYLGMFFKDPWGGRSVVNSNDNANKIKKTVNDLGIENWKTHQLYRFGIWKKDFEETRIYVADEFPFYTFGFNIDKQYYMNALLEELKKDVGPDNINIKWEIFSHDLDWGENALSKELDKTNAIGIVDGENTTLLDFLKNNNMTVFVFQHSKLSEKYMEIRRKYFTIN